MIIYGDLQLSCAKYRVHGTGGSRFKVAIIGFSAKSAVPA
jgi:hypothetical protein